MGMVTVRAGNAFVMHAAAQESSELVVLLVYLTIGVINVRSVHNRQMHLIEEIISRFEIPGQVASPRVTEPAIVHRPLACQPAHGRILFPRVTEQLLPFSVRFERSVTRFAADRHLGHRCMKAVCGLVVVFAHARVVAASAHVVPVHAPARPMTPFAGLAVLVAIDVEPFVRARIVGGFQRLVAPAGELNEELTQRIVTDDPLNSERLIAPPRPKRDHPILAVRQTNCRVLRSV